MRLRYSSGSTIRRPAGLRSMWRSASPGRNTPLSLVRVWREVDWFLSARAGQVPDLIKDKHAERARFAGACAPASPPPKSWSPATSHRAVSTVLLERSESARMLVLRTSTTDGGTGTIGSWYLEHARSPWP